MPTTPINGLRYPALSDNANVPLFVQNLANDVDSRLVARFANTAARDAAIPLPVDGLHCVVGGYRQVYRNGGWDLDEALPPVTVTGNTIGTRTDNVEDSWYSANIVDPGARYRIEANATGGRLFVSGTDTFVQMRIRAGSGALDVELPVVTFARAAHNPSPGNDPVLPTRSSGVLTGAARIVGFCVRTSGTGSWVLSTAPSIYYRVVPA